MSWDQAFVPIIVAGVPLVIALLKKLIPANSWVWPPLAALIGALADFANGLVMHGTLNNPLVGALLGLAGVGLREMVDQLKKAGK